ncbi:hypothetical protein FRC03_001494 [Tulasnella sp. 419]|nr:hypothetical protein FRC02_003764 [Tulasnella sp. 418]KAG8964652.1 hypothetical protein FRC03_001494 [Tulasnella sp. 419]
MSIMDPADFEYLVNHLEQEGDLKDSIREVVADLEKRVRTMTAKLSKVHSTPSSEIPSLVKSVLSTLDPCKESTAAIAALIPPNQFWRWKDLWARHLQSSVFVMAFCEYLTSGGLITLQTCSSNLGIKEEWKDRFYLQAEDYLQGIITMINELSRLAVNSVTMKQFETPFKISQFVQDVFAGFSVLNLKNDALRRRFDSIKYDVKRIEEVVYDVSLRNLNDPNGGNQAPNVA